MKKCLIMLLIACLLTGSALSERTLYAPYAGIQEETELVETLAELLHKQSGEDIRVVQTSGVTEAVNQFLADPDPEHAILVTNQDAYILSLQGYTNEDLRQAILPVSCVAASKSMFYAAPEVAEKLQEKTFEELVSYTEDNPYEIFLARMLDASHTDFLSVKETEDLYVDENLYTDFSDAKDNMDLDLIVMSTAMIPKAADCYVPLFSGTLPGIWQGVFVRNGIAEENTMKLQKVLEDICSDPDFAILKTNAGYLEEFSGNFAESVNSLVTEYVRYLTNQGLFFYEVE